MLLQNHDALLPLDKDKLQRVAVIGSLAERVVLNNYNGRHENLVTPLAGIKRLLGDAVEVGFAAGTAIAGREGQVGTRIDREDGFSRGESVKFESGSVGEFIEFPINVEVAGRYAIGLQYKTFPSRGRFQMSVDGSALGDPVDMFEANPRYGQKADFGERDLGAGIHRVRFTVVGRSNNSQGFTGHFDQLRLDGPARMVVES